MLSVLGGIGLGLVWGWLAERLVVGDRPMRAARMLLWVGVQALLVAAIGTPGMLGAFAAGLAAGTLLARAWRRTIEWRTGMR